MEPLDLTVVPPRSCRSPLLGYFLLARTIDKLRAELPGGNMGPYLNHDTGFSAYLVRKLGLDMDEFRDVVARASGESDVLAWLGERVDPRGAPELNAKLESFVVSKMKADDQVLVRQRHPVMGVDPSLDSILDILDAEDLRAFAR
jgi:hypothetical protein